jgi:hypothetical protein
MKATVLLNAVRAPADDANEITKKRLRFGIKI